ncbi:MAG TPA: zinc ribbon domain-containing protein [Candidatus Dormibacteraeota bacterium]|nr:zinc ribbon domain-containing protein [Candidatus Dormibacteraeota bacterium]
MAVFCPNCGTQNPETNRFCQSCGAQLPARAQAPVTTAAPQPAAPPAPAPAPSPATPPWAPSSPYYTPTQPQTLRRLPVGLIAGAVVALVILMSGVAVVAAAIAKGSGNNPQPSPHANLGPGNGPSPIPPASASPASQPTPSHAASPPPSTPSGGSVCNSSLCLTPAQGWTVKSKDDTSVLLNYGNPAGVAHFQAVKLSGSANATDVLQAIFDNLRKQAPDATICQQAQDLTAGGVKGLYIVACFTSTPQGGQATKITDLIWGGVNSDGTIAYEFDALSADSDFNNFLNVVNPLQHTVQWKI